MISIKHASYGFECFLIRLKPMSQERSGYFLCNGRGKKSQFTVSGSIELSDKSLSDLFVRRNGLNLLSVPREMILGTTLLYLM